MHVFLVLTALGRTSRTIVRSSGETGHRCLGLDLSGKALSVPPLKFWLAVGFLSMFFIKLRKFPSIPSVLSFYHEWVLDFVDAFFIC